MVDKGNELLSSAKAHLDAKELKESLADAEAAIKEFVRVKDSHGEAKAWAAAMDAKFASGACKSGISSGNAAIALFSECEDDEAVASTLTKMAAAHLEQKQPVPALVAGSKAMNLFKTMKNMEMQSSCAVIVAQAHIANGNAAAAVAVTKQLLASMKKSGADGKVQAPVAKCLWSALVAKGAVSEAADAKADALAICSQAGDKELEAAILSEAEEAGKVDPDVEKAAEEVKEDKAATERAVLLELAQAYKDEDLKAFHEAWLQVKEFKILGQDDINAVMWPLLDFAEDEFRERYCAMDWIDEGIKRGTKTYMRCAQRQGVYMQTRVGGMGYGPNFRQITIGCNKYHHVTMDPRPKGTGLGVLKLHTEIVPESGGWEDRLGWHAGLIDQGLAAQMFCFAPKELEYIDELWKFSFKG